MEFSWIFWNFVIPVLGSFLLPLGITYFYLVSWDKKKELRKLRVNQNYLQFLSPQGLLYYSLASSSLAFFTYFSSSAASKPTTPYIASFVMVLMCLAAIVIFYIGYFHKYIAKDIIYVPKAFWIAACAILALAGAFVSLRAYLWQWTVIGLH